ARMTRGYARRPVASHPTTHRFPASVRRNAMRAASAVVPETGKRAIDRVRTRRFLRSVRPINDEYVRRFGLEVRCGPFAGMRYAPGQEHISGHLIAKLSGSYERQIYPWLVTEWIDGSFDLLIDVGCAEGFYAVGL